MAKNARFGKLYVGMMAPIYPVLKRNFNACRLWLAIYTHAGTTTRRCFVSNRRLMAESFIDDDGNFRLAMRVLCEKGLVYRVLRKRGVYDYEIPEQYFPKSPIKESTAFGDDDD